MQLRLLFGLLLLIGLPAVVIGYHDLPLATTSHQPINAQVKRLNRWRNRTLELYAMVTNQISSFSPEEPHEIDGLSSVRVFQGIYEILKEKIAREDQPLDEMLHQTTMDDDYLEESSENELNSGIITSPCAPSQCKARFSTPKNRVPFAMPCSLASGFVPNQPQLPPIYEGNYDLCRTFEFDGAHFCTIKTGFLAIPLLAPKEKRLIPDVADMVIVGNLFLGKCVSTACDSEALKRRFFSGVKKTALKLMANARKLRLDILLLESIIEGTTEVQCVHESSKEQGDEHESMGTMLFFFLLAILVVIGIAATLFAIHHPNTHSKYVIAFSLPHNLASLTAPMKGDLLFLNGVRVLSLMWVVYGHTVLMGSTVSGNVPLANPTAVDNQLQEFSMTYIRSAEYAVDTFFFISGLLAAGGVIDAFYTERLPGLSFSTYLTLIFVRFIRLAPIYMFVMFFYTKALAYCGDGPYWHMNANRKMLEATCKNWYANLLYFNNLYPFGIEGGVSNCMGWTWYLANDMQFFLLVPILAALFVRQWKSMREEKPGRSFRILRLYGPCFLLVLIQIITTAAIAQHYNIQGVFELEFSAYIYVKPWCRVSPYAIGCALAMYRFDKKNSTRSEDDGVMSSSLWSAYKHHLSAIVGVALTSIITFVMYDDFRCRQEPASDCHIYFAFVDYGAMSSGNWPQYATTAYIALGYPAWGLALALLTNYAADGHGGAITRWLANPVFLPLTRLSYTVYMVQLICMQWFYAKAPAAVYSSPARHALDAVSFIALGFVVAFVLYLLVEKPFTTLLPWCLGFEKEKRQSQRTRTASVPLNQELNCVADVDSESVIIGSPNRRASLDLHEPLISNRS